MKPTMGSLFAGIGGFDLGFERAGFETLWQVEIDPWCRKVLAKNFPKAERFEDVRTVGSKTLRPVDVICGGFPCQDISNAGLRAGIDGQRSGLWGEMCRVIDELQPKYALVENVAALLGRGMGRVLGDLSEIGYDAEWEIVSAADVGAPHLRERVWIIAYPQSELRRWNDVRGDTQGGELQYKSLCQPKGLGAEIPHGNSERELQPKGMLKNKWGRFGDSDWWGSEPALDRVAYGVRDGVDRIRGLGNAVVPQIPELYARRIKQLLECAA